MWASKTKIKMIENRLERLFEIADDILKQVIKTKNRYDELEKEIENIKLGREAQHNNDFELREQVRIIESRINRHIHD